jgi:hypothetical protein
MVVNENTPTALETRARQLLDESVESIDMRVRSRLNQGRQAALARAARPRARFLGMPLATSAAGLCAACVLGVAVWIGMPSGERPMFAGEAQASFEDLDILASSEESSGDNLEMLQEDADFYEWVAEKSANPDGNGVG